MENKLQTSEWVSPGHPDKVADIISEYILDRIIEMDPKARYAVECQIKDNIVTLAGEATSGVLVTEEKLNEWVSNALFNIGYTEQYKKHFGKKNTIGCKNIKVEHHIGMQSPDIAQGVNKDGWGDQGIFFGMWCGETESGFTKDYDLARRIGQKLYQLASLTENGLGIDIKTQVTWDDTERQVDQVIVAIPTMEDKNLDKVTKDLKKFIRKEFPETRGAKFVINGTGAYHVHGPIGDSGTTGRKLVVDFYGSGSRIGGGSPWTKDPTKADLTLNLFARELAKLAFFHWREEIPDIHKVETEVSCCIGKPDIICTTTAYDPDGIPLHRVSEKRKVKPSFLIKRYNLDKPNYTKMCMEGLFSQSDLLR